MSATPTTIPRESRYHPDPQNLEGGGIVEGRPLPPLRRGQTALIPASLTAVDLTSAGQSAELLVAALP